MKNPQTLTSFFLLIFFLTSCVPEMGVPRPTATLLTATVVPTATTAPTITPTPAPETLADSLELSAWILEYVHAYGGTVWIEGEEMQVGELASEIRSNESKFTQTKKINGVNYSFIVVNDVPIVMRSENSKWEKATFAELARVKGLRVTVRKDAYSDEVIPQIGTSLMLQVGNESLFNADFDWSQITSNWDEVQSQLLKGKIPYQDEIYNTTDFYPTYWNYFDQVEYANTHHMEVDGDGVYDYWFFEKIPTLNSFTLEEQKEILFFMAAAKVLQFPEIMRVDVAGELIAHKLYGPTPQIVARYQELGGTAFLADLAKFLKQVRPDLKLRITEDLIKYNCLSYQDSYGGIYTQQYDDFFAFLQELSELQAPIDEVMIENNMWIYTPPDREFIDETLKKILDLGFEISTPDTVVGIDEFPPYMDSIPQVTLTPITEDMTVYEKQSEIYALVLDAYLDAGAENFGFGSAVSGTGDIYDDSLMPKLAYYAVVKTLYEHLP